MSDKSREAIVQWAMLTRGITRLRAENELDDFIANPPENLSKEAIERLKRLCSKRY